MKRAYSEMLRGCINEPEKRIWFALWFIELKSQPGVIAGEFSFKGLDDSGIIEIGYGLREGFCGKGYMTEAVRRISEWAIAQEGVRGIEAESAPNNYASQKVLANAGFIATGRTGSEGLRFSFSNDDIKYVHHNSPIN